jgi:serine/threonine-protein kinase
MAKCPACQRDLDDDFALCPYDGTSLTGEVPAVPPPQSQSAERVALSALSDRFDIGEMIGRGGMAFVFRAHDRENEMNVAIKVMNGVVARTSPGRARFLREAEVMSAIRHPNVVHVYAYGDLPNGAPYLVMEFLEGEPLGDLLRRGVSLPIKRAIQLSIDAASGLNAAHQSDIVHRDVKPDNIFLVGPKGAPKLAKMVDFGLARLYGATGLTAKGMIVGTPEYMSPEQAVNDPLDVRTDIYGLGVVMYRLLTGRLPFTSKSEVELLGAHLSLTPPPISELRRDVPVEVEHVVMSAMRKLPRNRYSTMLEFLEDLERLVGDRKGAVVGPASIWEDVYEAQTAFSKNIAVILRKKAKAG